MKGTVFTFKNKIIIVRKTPGLPYRKVCPKIAVYRPNPIQRFLVNLLQDHFAPLPNSSHLTLGILCTFSCKKRKFELLGSLNFVDSIFSNSGSLCEYSAILYSHKDPRVISERLGQELESCSKWLMDNKLSLHLGKTESILFGSKRKLKKINDFLLHVMVRP